MGGRGLGLGSAPLNPSQCDRPRKFTICRIEASVPLEPVMSYTDEKLEALLSEVESDLVERKESWKGDAPEKARQSVCAFADDRIEISSPGGPFGVVTKENFGGPGITDYRNPNLADAMKVLGFVQRFGIGIQSARAELQKNGNPEPEFQVEPVTVVATVRRRP